MSPKQGRRPTSGKRASGSAAGRRGPAEVRRLGLLVFGLAFVLLFAIVAIAVGVGHPSVPSGDVALVEDVPGDTGEISREEFDHALELVAKQAGEKKAPKPGTPKYEELKETALSSIFEAVWLQGLADEMGVSVTDDEIAAELKKLKKQSFKSKAEFKKFLKESGYTKDDVNERVKLTVLSQELQKELAGNVPKPSGGEIEAYYDAAKDTQFTQKPSRDVRMVVNKDRKKVEQALKALNEDDSAKSWSKVAKKYSETSTTKESGGLQRGVQEGILEEPLDADVFGADEGQVIGPVKTKQGFTVFEVESITPESTQSLKDVKAQIESTLAQRAEQEYFTSFVADYESKWTSRTFCAEGFVVDRCANAKGKAHPATAPEACYEANPKGGLPEAGCPAPVFQLVPALPGTVSPLEPHGKPLPQRPRPVESKEQAPTGLEGLPGGVVPPSGAPGE